MARPVSTIKALMVTTFQAQPELAAANSVSKRSIWGLLLFVQATAINVLEQLMDLFYANVAATVALSAPSTPQWLQAQILKFQYSATVPQVIQLINFVPAYPIVDPTLLLISRCSVTTTAISNAVFIKVAKLSPPVVLLSPEIAALQSYVNTIGVAGINYTVTSANPDNLFVQAAIYYQGAYVAVIQANVIAAITTFLAGLPFNGVVKVSDVENTIRNVPGVNDVVLQNIVARRDQDPISAGTYLVFNQQVTVRLWATQAGYIIPEATSGATLLQSLIFTPQ